MLLDIHKITTIADYFILCSGTSDRMLRTLANATMETMQNNYHLKGRVEGDEDDGWVVIDLIDIVVHIFSPEKREYYQLEELWQEGQVLLHLQ